MLSLYRKLGFATFVALAMLTAAIATGASVAPAQAGLTTSCPVDFP
jgi:hypothetical protein